VEDDYDSQWNACENQSLGIWKGSILMTAEAQSRQLVHSVVTLSSAFLPLSLAEFCAASRMFNLCKRQSLLQIEFPAFGKSKESNRVGHSELRHIHVLSRFQDRCFNKNILFMLAYRNISMQRYELDRMQQLSATHFWCQETFEKAQNERSTSSASCG
jgi:hypothetical protein